MPQAYRSGRYVSVAMRHHASWYVWLLVSLIMSPLVWMPSVAVAQVAHVFCDAMTASSPPSCASGTGTTHVSSTRMDVDGDGGRTALRRCLPPSACHHPQLLVHAMLPVHTRMRFHATAKDYRTNLLVSVLPFATVAAVSYKIRFTPPGSIPLYLKTQRLRL